MNDDLVLYENPHPGVICLNLNRPEKRNALNIPLLQALLQHLRHLKINSECRVLILRGAGPIFCAGLDLQEASQDNLEAESAALLAETLQTLYQMPQVTLAAIHGAALAGGAGIACACDFIVMEENAMIGFPEVRRGLVAAQVMVFLKKKLHDNKIKELTLLGENISAQKAYDIGLATQIAPSGQHLPICLDISQRVLKASPKAVEATKELIAALSSKTLSEEFAMAMKYHHAARCSPHAKEGITAFLEKRLPSWNNS